MSENDAILGGQPAPPPKVDPETLAIRTRRARAIRFKRGLIIGIAALGSVSLVTIAWVALKPQVFQRVADHQELSEPNANVASDALSDLPATYGDAPKLGPPLPGDLGRPVLEHQQSLGVQSGADADRRLADAEAAERTRLAAEAKAARESGLMVQSGGRPVAAADIGDAIVPAIASVAPDAAKMALGPERDPDGQQRKADFVSASERGGTVNAHALVPPASPYMLSAGSVIAASLITGLNSDLPGLVIAQVSQSVYDSATGRILLIPQGARLIGSYDSVVAFGQKRALVVWRRIVLPDGSSLTIDNVPATDPSGYAGLADKVDFHSWALLKGVALATLLGVGTEVTISGESDLVEAIRESTQQNASRAGDQLTSRNLSVQPTITIRPGAPVRLIVHKDLILAPWRH